MDTLRLYLDQFNLSLQDVEEKDKHTLSQKSVIHYSNDFLKSLSKAINKERSLILLDLLILEERQTVVKVSNDQEFIDAINDYATYIFIDPLYKEKRKKLVQSVLTEQDLLGFELGSRGGIHIMDSLFYWIMGHFGTDSKEYKVLENKLRRYRMKANDSEGALIYEQEETY